jgi:PIN domain nuclease of toxin-antitoxin system
VIVLDTHALIWWLGEPEELSARARRSINSSAGDQGVVASAISFFEISTLVRRGRLELRIDTRRWFAATRSLPELRIEPVSAEISWLAGELGAAFPGDPVDRIIAATAQSLGAKLVTADTKLQDTGTIETIW